MFLLLVECFLYCNTFILKKVLLIFLQVDSLEKLNKLLDACERIGVETNPTVIDEIGIIPLFSWYHEVITSKVTIFSSSVFHTMYWSGSKVLLKGNLFKCSTCFFDRALTKRRT